jgi:hypothetical protein
MRRNQQTEESFLNDVKNHKMTIFKDDGVYRHIRFKMDESSIYFFDLITGPGYLLVRGDMGTYEFERTNDMFVFFRMRENDLNNQGPEKLSINLGYWSEKCESVCRYGDIITASIGVFESIVNDHAQDYLASNPIGNEDALEEFNAKISDLIDFTETNESAMHEAIDEFNFEFDNGYFSIEISDKDVFGSDTWEFDFTEYSTHFTWICYAIVWGIKQYDAHKAAIEVDKTKVMYAYSLEVFSDGK